ncbi:MAG: hypothetical protein AB1641_05675 [Thermodesulfobacteriota bacterium]
MTALAPVLYAAPGSGLGHLVRAAAVCLALARENISSRIVTHSPYAPGLARLTGLAIDFIPGNRWLRLLPDYLDWLKPELAVLDTFPWGIRGEWAPGRIRPPRLVLLARRLKVSAYLEAAGLDWPPDSPNLARIILAEPLDEDYLERLKTGGGEWRSLPGRIRFPADDFPTPLPEGLSGLMADGLCGLIVHGGAEKETAALIELARAAGKDEIDGRLAVITPRPEGRLGVPAFEYFPAARLYDRARLVVTAVGYNCLAEMAGRPEKHHCLAFPRRYDDQAGRLAGPGAGIEDGGPAAAALIAAWL